MARLQNDRDTTAILRIFQGMLDSNDRSFCTVWHVYRTLEIPPRQGMLDSNDRPFCTVWHVYRTLEIPPRYLAFFVEYGIRMIGDFVLCGTFTER